MVSSDLYCPNCNALWDTEICNECGYMSEHFLRQSHKKKVREDEEKSNRKEEKERDNG